MNQKGGPNGSPALTRIVRTAALLYVAVVPLDLFPIAAGRSATGPAALLLIVAWLGSGRLPRVKPGAPFAILYLYLFWILATSLWSAAPDAGLLQIQGIVLQLAVVLIMVDLWPSISDMAFQVWALSCAAISIFLLMQPADAMRAGRASLDGIDENVTAMVLCMGFAVALLLCLTKKGLFGILYGCGFVLIGAAILRTGSRTGAISMALLTLVVIVAQATVSRAERSWTKTLSVLIVAAVAASYALAADLLPERVSDMLGGASQVGDSDRSIIIDAYLRHFSDWSAVGIGYGADSTYLGNVESIGFAAHSLFWKTWIETGAVGLLLLGVFLFQVAAASRVCVNVRAMTLMAVPLVCFAVTLGGAQTSTFWLVASLGLSKRHQEKLGMPRDPGEHANWGGLGRRDGLRLNSGIHGVR